MNLNHVLMKLNQFYSCNEQSIKHTMLLILGNTAVSFRLHF